MLLSLLFAAVVAAEDARDPLPPRIDALIAAGSPDFARTAAPPADDAEFLRRVYLDLTGTIPPAAEVRAFLADSSPDKRGRLIDRLLDSPGHVRRMVWFWDTTLMERRADAKVPRQEWENYLNQAVAENRPYDALVRELFSSDGTDPKTRPAAKFLLDRNLQTEVVIRDIARVFLGRDLQCAQCHDHPSIPDFTQADYYGLAAFLNRSFLFPKADDPKAVLAEKAEGEVSYTSVFDKSKTQHPSLPRVLDGPPVAEPKLEKGKEYQVAPAPNVRPVPTYSRRAQLAAALTTPQNRAFARTAVNRLWAMLMGRGLVHPADMDHSGNPPSHPELLDLLANEFVRHNHDVRWFIRQICRTQAYQRSSAATTGDPATLPPDRYLVGPLKPLTAEQLAFALAQAGGHANPAAVLPAFRTLFGGRPGESQSAFSATLDQALFLKHNATIQGLLAGRVAQLAQLTDDTALAEELFLNVLSRFPSDEERADVREALRRSQDRRAAVAELVWALATSAEFRFNH